jgi:integrase/recombinase XerC
MRRLIHRYLEHLAHERRASPQTLRAYEKDLLEFHEFLARDFLAKDPNEVRPAEVDALAVRSFLAALTGRGLSKRSQARTLSAVRSLFRFACREGTLSANPAQAVRTPKYASRLPRHLRPGEVETLVEAPSGSEPLDRRDRAILELLYAAGLRVGELVSLDWGDIDLSSRTLRVLGKGGKERMVPFGRTAQEALIAWREVCDEIRAPDVEGDPVLVGAKGKRLSDRVVRSLIDRWVGQTSIAAGVHPHTLRHTLDRKSVV